MLSYGDPTRDAITASASARFAQDLDGDQRTAGFSPFDSLDDTYSHAATARLYTAYVDFHRPLPGMRLRAGRQWLEEFPEAVAMDGATVWYDVRESVTLSLFGGLPSNLFESSPSGDFMYGGAIEIEPWQRGRGRLEYLHLEDETTFGLFDDDLVGLSFQQGWGSWSTYARYTVLEGDSRDLTARLTGSFPEAGFLTDAQLTYLFKRQEAHAYAIDPYSIFLLDLEPYVQLALRASKAFGEHVAIDVSATGRELVDGEDEKPYNHEFIRWSVSPRLDGWPIRDMSVSLVADYWVSSADDFSTLGGDVSYQLHRDVTLGGGSAYALYVIDVFTGEERERIRTYYVSARWKVRKGSTLDVRFIYEDNDFDNFRTLEVGASHAF